MNNTPRYSGTRIKTVLDDQGRRQDWLAAKVDVTPATVNRWIHGTRTLDFQQAMKVSNALGVPFSLMFELPKGNRSMPRSAVSA
jgi:transcriptional regulator with XRE-family HTH domain